MAGVSQRARRQAALIAQLKRNGAGVFRARENWYLSDRRLGEPPPPAAYAPEWLRKRLGEDFFDVIDTVYATRFDPKLQKSLPLAEEEMNAVCEICRAWASTSVGESLSLSANSPSNATWVRLAPSWS